MEKVNEIKTTEKTEIHQKSLVVLPTSIQAGDKVSSTLRTQEEGERQSNKTESVISPGEIDSSHPMDAMLKGKQDFKETLESGSSTNLDKEKQKSSEENTKDCNQQETYAVATKRSHEKSENNNIDNTIQKSAKENLQNDDNLGSKPKKRRKYAAKVTDNQNTSSVSQENCKEDVDAEWNVDEKRKLLDALDIDTGRRQWNAISKQVKTKNIQQVKHFTEKLRAEANGQAPVHLGGEKDDTLQAWISICERLRGGQEEIDAKCIPQVITIAAVEPTPSTQENTNGPSYARIYTFLSSILKGQASTEGLTPIDARVVLELIQSLEMKMMNADLNTQQGFLRNRYTSVTKDLEKEQIIFAMDELQKEIVNEELNSHEGEGSGLSNCQLLGESTETAVHTQNDERSTSSNTLVSYSSNSEGDSHTEVRAEKDHTPMDIQTDEGSVNSEPLPSCTATVTDSEQVKMSSDEMGIGKAKTPMDIQMEKRQETSESLPSETATVLADSGQTNNDKNQSPIEYIQTEEKLELSEPLPSSNITDPDSEQTKMDETRTSNHQSSPTNSKMGETSEISNSISCLQNTATAGSKRTRAKQINTPHSTEETTTRKKSEPRKLKIRRLKRGLNKPKLSSLNPICVPVMMLNVKPKSYQTSIGRK